MKKYIFILLFVMTGVLSGCDSYLDTEFSRGKDANEAIQNVDNANTALQGTYSLFYDYRFAGNFAMTLSDIPTDISYWNQQTGHMNGIYEYATDDNDTYLYYIWDYGYKIVSNATRLINQGDDLAKNLSSASDKATLNGYLAQAHGLRAFANLYMVNYFAHQYKVNGQDFGKEPGIVISDATIQPYDTVHRATIAESYAFIVKDLKTALDLFNNGADEPAEKVYLTKPAIEGLLARTYLYMEEWANAKSYAEAALKDGDIDLNKGLAHTKADYAALYQSTGSNNESFFYLSIDDTHNFSANAAGNIWNTYSYSPSPKLQRLYASTDCRDTLIAWDVAVSSSTPTVPYYAGGKYGATKNGVNGVAYETNYLINAPEMFLIIAEADIKQGNLSGAQENLFQVARRNTAIKSVADLPQTLDGLYSFLKDERARELFQEGHRLSDLRRWGDQVSVVAYGAPNVKFNYTDYQISDLVYPIPNAEINAHFGVEQNEGWAKTFPKK